MNTVSPPKSTILLIEDEEHLLLGLAAIMTRAGFEVLTASDGQAGLELARHHEPDLIISDVMMPPPNGFELHALLRDDPNTASIPFLFLTARTSLQDKVQGIESGADDYITKPFDPRELVARVQSTLRRQNLGHEQGMAEAKDGIEQLHRKILNTVGGEMQKPVAALLATLKQIHTDRCDEDPDRIAEFAKEATNNGRRIDSMVKDLIALATLEEGQEVFARKPVIMEKIVLETARACLRHWTKFEFRDLDLVISGDLKDTVLVVNEELIGRSIFHLVDNACKFSPDGGAIEVSVETTPENQLVISVRDQGNEIPVAERAQIFEPFIQGPQSHPGMYSGLGLGLTIAERTARSHGGDVHLFDSPGGKTFQIVLPLDQLAYHGRPTIRRM